MDVVVVVLVVVVSDYYVLVEMKSKNGEQLACTQEL